MALSAFQLQILHYSLTFLRCRSFWDLWTTFVKKKILRYPASCRQKWEQELGPISDIWDQVLQVIPLVSLSPS